MLVAVGRFNEIVHDRAAWDLNADQDEDTADYMQDDDEYDEDKDAVPVTKSASRILSLIESVTGKCKQSELLQNLLLTPFLKMRRFLSSLAAV